MRSNRNGGRGDACLACVYRSRNATNVERLLRPALQAGWDVRLWALDEVVPSLAAWTCGSGPGTKFENCNRLGLGGLPSSWWVVVVDDDIHFSAPGDLVSFLGLSRVAGLDLGQPAHGHGSFASHVVTHQAVGSLVRLTGFVEIGPAFAVSPRVRSRLLPFPDVGMGWGLEARWSTLTEEGFRLGIVDATDVHHQVLAGTDYDRAPEFERQAMFLAERGVETMADLVHGTDEWRTFDLRRAPWLRDR